MSNQADYYCPEETPLERDPTPEEMMENAPPEERMLAKIEQIRFWLPDTVGLTPRRLLREIEDYFHQAIEQRDAPNERDDPDAVFVDPFAD